LPGTIDFRYDQLNEMVVATPRWTIRTREDCETWYRQWVDYLSTFGRTVDCVMVLDEFHVEPEIAKVWGEFRARINNEHIRHSFRVRADWAVRLFAATSGVRYNAASNEAATVEAAIEGIRQARSSKGQ
jgi:hypothetical protein